MKRQVFTTLCFITIAVAMGTVLPASARAHWCNDNWGTSFNLTVKPETDTVSVPTSGSAQLNIWVQNNMGYALPNFTLNATAPGYTVTVDRGTLTEADLLMPSEKVRYTLTISGGDNLQVDSLEFYVSFGNLGQSGLYGNSGGPVMIKKADGSLYPGVFAPIGGNDQAMHHRHAATADFGDSNAGINELLQEYCAGRRSWDHTSVSVIPQYCPDTSSTVCSDRELFSSPSKWDLQKLWVTYELAIRKIALGDRIAVLRDRLQCGWDDPDLTFQALAAFALGYLGEDEKARSFLEGIISQGSADEAAIARASLLLMGNIDDLAIYGAEVSNNMSSPTVQVAYVSAAALAIVEGNDTAVQTVLLKRARWVYPESDSTPFLASHLLGIVAWDRRGWNVSAGDLGGVTFYGEDAPSCAEATVSPLSGAVPFSATLDASGCTDPQGDNLSYNWTIEDVSYAEVTVEHTFSEPGNYVVRLTVTDAASVPTVSSRTFNVTVLPGSGETAGSGGSDSDPAGSGSDPAGSGSIDPAGSGSGGVGGSEGGSGSSGSGASGDDSKGGSGSDTGGSGSSTDNENDSPDGGAPDGGLPERDSSDCSCSLHRHPTDRRSGLLFATLVVGFILFTRRRLHGRSAIASGGNGQ